MTNREWLNTLSDEDFAKWHIEIGCGTCAFNPMRGACSNAIYPTSYKEEYCIEGTSKWLQQEHKHKENMNDGR